MATKPNPKSTHPINLSGDVVRRRLTLQMERGEVSEEQADLIWWFYTHAKDNAFSFARAAEVLNYKDGGTMRRLFLGEYGAKVDNIIEKMETYKTLAEERSSYKDVLFVETRTAKRVFQACDAALISQTVVFIIGDSQIGKSEAMKEYQRQNNHGKTRYLSITPGSSYAMIVKSLGKSCYVTSKKSTADLYEKIIGSLTDRNVLLIDEVHQVFETVDKHHRLKIMELFRNIHDQTGCGLVLCGTHTMKKEIEEGVLSKHLEQLRRRGTVELNLPPRPTWSDLDLVASQFGLESPGENAKEIVKLIIHENGLGRFIKYLQNGNRLASKAGQKMTWRHFTDAYMILQRLSTLDANKKELGDCV